MTDVTAELNTVAWGDTDAKNTALLVHGLTGRADAFRALIESLESEGLTGWRFLAVDLRAGERPGGWTARPASRPTPRTSSRSWTVRASVAWPTSGIRSGP